MVPNSTFHKVLSAYNAEIIWDFNITDFNRIFCPKKQLCIQKYSTDLLNGNDTVYRIRHWTSKEKKINKEEITFF